MMAEIPEHSQAVLLTDLPEHGHRAGEVGVVVMVHQHGQAYEVEFFTHAGATIAVAAVRADQVRPIAAQDVVHARRRAS